MNQKEKGHRRIKSEASPSRFNKNNDDNNLVRIHTGRPLNKEERLFPILTQ